MGLNNTPNSNRFTIGIYGKRNAGKSTLINAITDQSLALTSPVPGTTTDPVSKAMELLPIGPIMLIDTAGIDDSGELGMLRVKKSYEALRRCNMVLLVCDATLGIEAFNDVETEFIEQLKKRNIPAIVVINKIGLLNIALEKIEKYNQLLSEDPDKLTSATIRINDFLMDIKDLQKSISLSAGFPVVLVDAAVGEGIDHLKKQIVKIANVGKAEIGLTDGLVEAGDIVVLVTPIDSAAPKGRMILPQQQVMRDILDKGAIPVLTREFELPQALEALRDEPKCVITDSQAFREVSEVVPRGTALTSFSILFARQKGDIERMLEGIRALRDIKPGDKILIAEACTHHRQKDDIGTVKIPRLIRKIEPGVEFSWVHGGSFPEDLKDYKLVIHCGACMIGRQEMMYRINYCEERTVPITNYGLVLAYVNGILERAIEPLGLKL